MFIIWKGWGILVIPIVAVCFVVIGGIVATIGAALGASSQSTGFLIMALSAGASGFVSYVVGKRLNAGPGRVLVDKETGREITLKNSHSLFFIKMEYYGYVFAVIGALALLGWILSLFSSQSK